jgi:hypothetical protein
VYLVEGLDELGWGIPGRSTLAFFKLRPCCDIGGDDILWDLAVLPLDLAVLPVLHWESIGAAGQQLDCGKIEGSLHYI